MFGKKKKQYPKFSLNLYVVELGDKERLEDGWENFSSINQWIIAKREESNCSLYTDILTGKEYSLFLGAHEEDRCCWSPIYLLNYLPSELEEYYIRQGYIT